MGMDFAAVMTDPNRLRVDPSVWWILFCVLRGCVMFFGWVLMLLWKFMKSRRSGEAQITSAQYRFVGGFWAIVYLALLYFLSMVVANKGF